LRAFSVAHFFGNNKFLAITRFIFIPVKPQFDVF